MIKLKNRKVGESRRDRQTFRSGSQHSADGGTNQENKRESPASQPDGNIGNTIKNEIAHTEREIGTN